MLVQKNFSDIITFARASARWRMGSAGLLVQDAINIPSLTYDPITLAPRGLIIEQQRTNLFKYSQDLTNVVWNKQSMTLTANATVAPDGSNTGSLLVPTAVAGVAHNLEQNSVTGAGAIGAANTQSYYVKAAGYNRVAIWWPNTGAYSAFDLSTGTQLGGQPGTITPLANGWFHISSVYAQPTTVGTAARFYILEPGTSTVQVWASAADGVSGVYIWQAQIEAAGFASSPIPTTAAQATRAADSAVITDLTKLAFNPMEGTLYLEALPSNGIRADGGTQYALALEDAAVTNFFSVGRTSARIARFTARFNGANQSDIIVGPWADNAIGKMACSWGAGSVSMSFNGGNANVSAMASSPVNLSKLQLGLCNIDGSSYWSGPLRNVRYIPRKLTDAELKTMTT